MSTIDIFNQLQKKFVIRVSKQLTQCDEFGEHYLQQVKCYYDHLQKVMIARDSHLLHPILAELVQIRTQTEVKERKTSLTVLLNQIFVTIHQLASEELNPKEALDFIGELLPIQSDALKFIAQQETQAHIEHVSLEIEKVRVQLEKLDRSKSDFISLAAHGLKTPLTLIEGYVDMLRESVPDNPQVNLLLKGVGSGTRLLQEIVEDIIDVSLIDNNLIDLNYRPICFEHLFDKVIDEFSKSIHAYKQTLDFHDFPGIETMTYGDSDRVYQVLRNIFSYVNKYTPDIGTITVDGRLLPGFIEITISDTGIGISSEDQERIFQKFSHLGYPSFHSSGKTNPNGGGSGLGLPIAKGIIEAHGGAIWVVSEGYNEETCPGVTFHILFPIYKSPPGEKAKKLLQYTL